MWYRFLFIVFCFSLVAWTAPKKERHIASEWKHSYVYDASYKM
jgi:hypothetical protein